MFIIDYLFKSSCDCVLFQSVSGTEATPTPVTEPTSNPLTTQIKQESEVDIYDVPDVNLETTAYIPTQMKLEAGQGAGQCVTVVTANSDVDIASTTSTPPLVSAETTPVPTPSNSNTTQLKQEPPDTSVHTLDTAQIKQEPADVKQHIQPELLDVKPQVKVESSDVESKPEPMDTQSVDSVKEEENKSSVTSIKEESYVKTENGKDTSNKIGVSQSDSQSVEQSEAATSGEYKPTPMETDNVVVIESSDDCSDKKSVPAKAASDVTPQAQETGTDNAQTSGSIDTIENSGDNKVDHAQTKDLPSSDVQTLEQSKDRS